MHCSKFNMLCSFLACGVLSCSAAVADEEGTSKSVTQKVEVKVQSSSSKSSEDSDAETSVSGRIVIVGPDGERKEYSLDDKLPGNMKLDLNSIANGFMISPNQATEDSDKPRYMIGVVCEPADKVLRSHLKLKGVGLVVKRLSDEMPAAKAGLVEGDILLGVGDRDFSTVQDLVTAVAECDGEPLTFRRMHHGEVSNVTVTAIESNTAKMLSSLNGDVGVEQFEEILRSLNLPDAQLQMLRKLGGGNNGVMIQSFGPGIELDAAADFEEKFTEILANSRKNTETADPDAGEELKKMKQEIEENRAALIKLRKELRASESSQ